MNSLAVCVFQEIDKETAPIILANEFRTEVRPAIQKTARTSKPVKPIHIREELLHPVLNRL